MMNHYNFLIPVTVDTVLRTMLIVLNTKHELPMEC